MKRRENRNIPTEAEFDAASKAMTLRIAEEQRFKDAIIRFCSNSPVFYDVYVWLNSGGCSVDLFVKTDADARSIQAEELKVGITTILSKLIGAGRRVSVEVDSDERVVREYKGSYFYRLR